LRSSEGRLSVTLVDVQPGKEEEFLALAIRFEALLIRKEYGRAETIRDEAQPLRFYAVRHWSDVAAAERCHGDPEIQALTAQLHQLARVTHVVNGVRRPDTTAKLLTEDRRARVEADRRTDRIPCADLPRPALDDPPSGAWRGYPTAGRR
jgi:quinol monooxygenase YgiN